MRRESVGFHHRFSSFHVFLSMFIALTLNFFFFFYYFFFFSSAIFAPLRDIQFHRLCVMFLGRTRRPV